MKNFPDINAVLGGQSLESYLASGGAKSVFFIAEDTVLPYALNTTGGFGWQLNGVTSLDVDLVHQYATHQLGANDRNLPASGRISASNPRPHPRFTEVKVMENFTDSWYDALETQVRTRVRGTDSLQVSYTLSRSYRDGVDHYQTYRGTMRTPHEIRYSDTDTRHNFSAATSTTLPWKFQLSGIVRWISGSPRSMTAGFDIDGDSQTQNDRPASGCRIHNSRRTSGPTSTPRYRTRSRTGRGSATSSASIVRCSSASTASSSSSSPAPSWEWGPTPERR